MYHYAGNNPVKYTDPDGRNDALAIPLQDINFLKAIVIDCENLLNEFEMWAANAAQADGQLPIGDAVGLGVLAGVGIYAGIKVLHAEAKAHSIVKDKVREIAESKTNTKGVGSYTIMFASGKRYHGKGPFERAKSSAIREGVLNLDLPIDIDWTPSANDRKAFEDEYSRLSLDGSYRNPDNYNRIQSPGRKKYIEDYGRPHPADPDQSM